MPLSDETIKAYRISDSLSIYEAAMLLIELEPLQDEKQRDEQIKPPAYHKLCFELINGIMNGDPSNTYLKLSKQFQQHNIKISRKISPVSLSNKIIALQSEYEEYINAFTPESYKKIDVYNSFINKESLAEWCLDVGITPKFLEFEIGQLIEKRKEKLLEEDRLSVLLDKNHPCYCYELAIAIKIWMKIYSNVSDTTIFKEKTTPKQEILKELEKNYSKLKGNAKKRIATMINIFPDGGSPIS